MIYPTAAGGAQKFWNSQSSIQEEKDMDEHEFNRLLNLFPVVRSRDYNAETESLGQTSSSAQRKSKRQDELDIGSTSEAFGTDLQDPFWQKLKLVAEKKMGTAEAARFCKAFQYLYKNLVYEELSLDAARSFLNSRT